MASAAASATAAPTATAAGARPPSPPPFILHQVQRSDTIDGLAFRYRVTKAEIRLANDLPSDNVHTCSVLKIPRGALPPLQAVRDPGDTRGMILRRFRVSHSLSEAEARYYLDDANWDEPKAAAALARDLAFERSHAGDAAAAVNGVTIVSRVDAAAAARRSAASGGPGVVSRGAGGTGGTTGLGGVAGRLVTSLLGTSSSAAAVQPASGSDDADEGAALLLLDRHGPAEAGGGAAAAAGHLPGTALRHRRKAGSE